ncbi:MAG: peptidase M14 [Saprospiraceae bacterium]|nr:peptidase M14 [Saprospiraceae bacterium]
MRNSKTLLLFGFFLASQILQAQDFTIARQLFTAHEKFKAKEINDMRFMHKDIQPLLETAAYHKDFSKKKLGESIEGRDIHLLSYGEGATSVLLWSQMHGDEPTATMALMDIFNFLTSSDDFDPLRRILKRNLNIHFIPMLNPDGAQRFMRHNANYVDLNRDALRLQNPESRILKAARDSLDAKWGFNLHDQNRYYAAGITENTASISFLAPAYNYDKDINEVRGNAMKLIVGMNRLLQKYLPGHVGRYNDAFEPRAFGDNIQKWGTSTILVESGGLKNDPEKQHLRKLHFVLLLSSLLDIAEQKYEEYPMEEYEEIPYNDSNSFHDFILRKAQVERNGKTYTLDLAWRSFEIDREGTGEFWRSATIMDVGDLSILHGYEEFDGATYSIEPAKVYPKVLSLKKIKKLDWKKDLVDQGYLAVRLKKSNRFWRFSESPIRIIHEKAKMQTEIRRGGNPAFFLKRGGVRKYFLTNGKLWDLEQTETISKAWKRSSGS